MENIFITNKYTHWYFSIINNAKSRIVLQDEYYENHHVIPESFFINRTRKGPAGWLIGDPESVTNKVKLTGHEHFVCHLLLTKMVTGPGYYKVLSAANGMRRAKKGQKRYVASGRIYAIIKKKFAEEHSAQLKGRPTGRTDNGLTGYKQSQQTIEKRVKKLKGQKRTDTQRENMRNAQLAREEKTPEEKEEYSRVMSKAKKGKPLGPQSKQHKKNLSKALKGSNKGVLKSEATKQNMRKPKSESHRKNMIGAKRRITRLFDKKEMYVNDFTRWVKKEFF